MSKILVVDDSLSIRKQVGSALKSGGFEVVEAVDGIDACEKLRAHEDIRFVVCDVSMPRMGGIEFLEVMGHIRSGVIAVMLTTEAQPELMARAKALGAKGWLTKPMNKELLLSLANHFLGEVPSTRAIP